MSGETVEAGAQGHAAELYIQVAPCEAEVATADFDVVRIAISKHFWTQINRVVQAVLWHFEEDGGQAAELVGPSRPAISWAFTPKGNWPEALPLLEVTRLTIDEVDYTRGLRRQLGPSGQQIFEAEFSDRNDGKLHSVRIDVRTFLRGRERLAPTFYLPQDQTVKVRVDGSRAGFDYVWLQGVPASEQSPFVV